MKTEIHLTNDSIGHHRYKATGESIDQLCLLTAAVAHVIVSTKKTDLPLVEALAKFSAAVQIAVLAGEKPIPQNPIFKPQV